MSLFHYACLIDKNIIPDDWTKFDCYMYNLTKLPELPSGLKILSCSGNRLTALPQLPYGLQELYCYYNNITELPELPSGLKILFCHCNNITQLPQLPSGLIKLFCNFNPIKYITPDIYSIMKNIYLTNVRNISISNTIFYDNTGCSSKAEFFGC